MLNNESFHPQVNSRKVDPNPQPNVTTRPPDKSFTSAVFMDIPYSSLSETNKLDLYLPAVGQPPYPVIVSIHGGGWRVGDKIWRVAEIGEQVLARGYAVVSFNHRLSSEALFPAQIYDAKAAIRWVRANTARYGLDENRIISWGGSSGGHLSALLGTSGNVTELEDLSMGNPEQSSRVNAVVAISSPIDFLQLDPQARELGLYTEQNAHDVEGSAESGLVGGKISLFLDRCAAANPVNYIGPDNPPFYIWHGKKDEAVPYLQSVILAEALRKVIGEENVMLVISEDAGHGVIPEDIDGLLAFLEEKLA